MKNILVISYFWPPNQTIGVQRWLQLSKQLLKLNVNPIILTVDENSAIYSLGRDDSLLDDIPAKLRVYKSADSSFWKKILEALITKRTRNIGDYFINNSHGILQIIRRNIIVPDIQKSWIKSTIKMAHKVIIDNNIDVVITTGPPHSVHLIGLKLKKDLGIKWIPDFRDPWSDSKDFQIKWMLKHTIKRNEKLEYRVLKNADKIFTVGTRLKNLLLDKNANIDESKISVVTNGFDRYKMNQTSKKNSKEFIIYYTGTMSEIYRPEVFFQAISDIQKTINDIQIKIDIIGHVAESVKKYASSLGININFIDAVSHRESIEYQQKASLLLMIIPDEKHAEAILTGKLFEYLATNNPILCIGPKIGDAADIINKCSVGKVFERNERTELGEYIRSLVINFKNRNRSLINHIEIKKYHRINQAIQVKKELLDL